MRWMTKEMLTYLAMNGKGELACRQLCLRLFCSSEEATKTKRRRLDDEELDSGDDEGRQDRIEGGEMDGYGEQEEAISENRQRTLLDVDLSRHPVPDPSDCEVSSHHSKPRLSQNESLD